MFLNKDESNIQEPNFENSPPLKNQVKVSKTNPLEVKKGDELDPSLLNNDDLINNFGLLGLAAATAIAVIIVAYFYFKSKEGSDNYLPYDPESEAKFNESSFFFIKNNNPAFFKRFKIVGEGDHINHPMDDSLIGPVRDFFHDPFSKYNTVQDLLDKCTDEAFESYFWRFIQALIDIMSHFFPWVFCGYFILLFLCFFTSIKMFYKLYDYNLAIAFRFLKSLVWLIKNAPLPFSYRINQRIKINWSAMTAVLLNNPLNPRFRENREMMEYLEELRSKPCLFTIPNLLSMNGQSLSIYFFINRSELVEADHLKIIERDCHRFTFLYMRKVAIYRSFRSVNTSAGISSYKLYNFMFKRIKKK